MRCITHKRETMGDCMWCGKKLCEHCVAKQEGRKFYCEHCAVSLVPYKRERLPTARPTTHTPTPAPVVETPQVKRRFVLGKDGYFEVH